MRLSNDQGGGAIGSQTAPSHSARIALGFTQEQLAERMDVDPSTVRRWESGASENGPKPWLRPKLGRHLQVSIDQLDDLLADTDEPEAQALARLDAPEAETGVTLASSLHHVESLRCGLHDVLAEGALSDASLDEPSRAG
jgi:transcriptional regulator with XRE-family HTH domain